ncbi:MAG: hypothetical protein IT290_09235 [Deltaproteobacteria bacterium]|nr:hypothetical protein [Deltaproteobacteria bacterium]
MRKLRRYKYLSVFFLPVFVSAVMFCGCSAAFASQTLPSKHHCCPDEQGDEPIERQHQDGCAHCGQLRLLHPESVKLPSAHIVFDTPSFISAEVIASIGLDGGTAQLFVPIERPPLNRRALHVLKRAYLL